MARRHPSSDLSICISFILDTNSVRTLQARARREKRVELGTNKINSTLLVMALFRFEMLPWVLGCRDEDDGALHPKDYSVEEETGVGMTSSGPRCSE